MRIRLWALLLLTTPVLAQPGPKTGPELELVKDFGDWRTLGLAVSRAGRIFASAPYGAFGNVVVEVDPRTGAVTPYPDAAWNDAKSTGPHWRSVQGITVDSRDRLWLLDTARPREGFPDMPQKLVQVDLATNRVARSYSLEKVMGPGDVSNDVVVDVAHNRAYISNTGNRGSIVVLSLDSGVARHALAGDVSVMAVPGRHLLLNGTPALRADGTLYSSNVNGIALSPDGRWLYYRAVNTTRFYRVPTADLANESLAPAALSARVQMVGEGVVAGGLVMDAKGRLFAGDLEHASVVMMTPDVQGRLQSRIFANQPDRLAWADGFAISQGWLYISNSRLNQVLFQNSLPRTGPYSILRVRLPE
jgi:sugar lactone lactonase YvrE